MILTSLCFYYFHSLLFTQFSYYLSDIFFQFPIYFFSSVFWCECDTILNHTELYEYRHGKMLIHFRFVFESLTVLNSPGEYMRYYRIRRGLTTRQLADKLHIVPATVCGYEQGRFPLPYDIAVAISELLHIPANLIFDEYCSFISFPYTERLHKIRANYRLSQAEFANRANIASSIYAKWESGYRRPSRKMYLALKSAYPEI